MKITKRGLMSVPQGALCLPADRKPGTPTAEQSKPSPVPVAGTFRLLVPGR
jgi:hypothetical protein